MAKSGETTRRKILDATERLVYDHGLSATTVDRVVEAAGVTKGALFHHFKSKADLATALLERYAEMDRDHQLKTLARAEKLSDDPLQQVLIFVGLLQEDAQEIATDGIPGCLFASYAYERMEFPELVGDITREAMNEWTDRLANKLEEAGRRYPPRIPVDYKSLAENLLTLIEGAFIVSRSIPDRDIFTEQLEHWRQYISAVFQQPSARAAQ